MARKDLTVWVVFIVGAVVLTRRSLIEDVLVLGVGVDDCAGLGWAVVALMWSLVLLLLHCSVFVVVSLV